MECGGIYHIGSHGEQFSLFMVRCLGYFCNWLHFDRDLLFMLLSKMISLSPVIMPYDLLTAMPDFHLFFFLEIKQYLVSLVLMKKTHKNVPT